MFGPDTNLIFGAIQMAAVTAAFTGGAVYLLMRRKRKGASSDSAKIEAPTAQSDLEERVRVLERIATDPATRLAEEFEQLEKAESQTEERV